MKLVVFSHKPCWVCSDSPTGYATDGGFPFQIKAVSELFDETHVLVPCTSQANAAGEIVLNGHNLRIVPLSPRYGAGVKSKLSFLPWLLRNSATIWRELNWANGVHAPIPGDVGTVGMLGAWLLRKRLFVRHCGNWLKPVTLAEKFWRWFMDNTAGGRNVMLATGGTAEPPSTKNPNVRWIFSSSLTEKELSAYAYSRTYPLRRLRPLTPDSEEGDENQLRLIIVARQEKAKGTDTIIRSLPQLATDFPDISLEVVGEGPGIPYFKELAIEMGVEQRVRFSGKLNHEEVMQRLRQAHLFIFPTTSSDGFPKAVLEGLASGLPVVATRVSVLPRLVGNGCGMLMDDPRSEVLTRCVKCVLSDPAAYEAMSRNAIETARRYSLECWRNTIGVSLAAAWGPLKRAEGERNSGAQVGLPKVEARG